MSLALACQGKTKKNGGLNVDGLKALAKSSNPALNVTKMLRSELVAMLCGGRSAAPAAKKPAAKKPATKKPAGEVLSARTYYDTYGQDATIGHRCDIRKNKENKCLLWRKSTDKRPNGSPYWQKCTENVMKNYPQCEACGHKCSAPGY